MNSSVSFDFFKSKPPSARKLVEELIEYDEDFEWYPTTEEILCVVKRDIHLHHRSTPTVLDCGAGDGRSLCYLTEGNRYAIEKSTPLLNQLDPSIVILGTDFHQQTLIDKKVDIVFCNPPYSEYSKWMDKIIREANASFVYFVVPERWNNNRNITASISDRDATYYSLDKFDFLSGDRPARAKVEILCVRLKSLSRSTVPAFDLWFSDYFNLDINTTKSSKYEYINQTKPKFSKGKVKNELVVGSNIITVLEKLYSAELADLVKNYKHIVDIDQTLLAEMNVSLESIKKSLELKIECLKDKYWRELFENFDKITSRLTSYSRQQMLDRLNAHTHIDFTVSNAHAVLIWVIKNSNQYLDQQLITTIEKLTERANIKLYKSNQRTFRDEEWRYVKRRDFFTHYFLDYRIILESIGGIIDSPLSSESVNGLAHNASVFINDLLTVANNLGFDTTETSTTKDFEWESGKKISFDYKDYRTSSMAPLMEVKAFKKGTLHIKLNQAFICKLNVEFGRLKGWLKDHSQAADELNISPKDAKASFKTQFVIGNNDILALGLKLDQ